MKNKYYLSALIVLLSSILLIGCKKRPAPDAENTVIRSTAAALSEQDIQQLSEQACTTLDEKSIIIPTKSRYHSRLAKVTDVLGYQINDIPLNYQIYSSATINAVAMANGCVRINTGLMDKMNNDEILAVLAHEIGHIALDHKRKAFQASHQIETSPDTHEVFIIVDKQFSYQQEIEADNYALALLIKQGIKPDILLTMFSKLNQSTDAKSAHPPLAFRRQNIINKINTVSKLQEMRQLEE